jgi:hypothetical protein
MPQLHLPMFPNGVTAITDVLAFAKQDGRVTYFSGQLPVFGHAEDDVASFRMITSQFCVQGCARQSDIIRAFGVTSISVKRSVKIYREKGPKGFYTPRVTRGPAVLVDGVVVQAEERLAEGASVAAVAEQLNVKLNTLQKAIRAWRIRTPVKKKIPTLSPPAPLRVGTGRANSMRLSESWDPHCHRSSAISARRSRRI